MREGRLGSICEDPGEQAFSKSFETGHFVDDVSGKSLDARLVRQAREDEKQGVFKHTRGILRTWALPEDELHRLNALDDPEVVLFKRPFKLYIEVPTGTASMPVVDGKKMYTLTVQARPWSLDKAGAIKICRYGFPILP